MKIFLPLVALLGTLVISAESASAASPAYCDGYARHYANQRAGGNAVGGAALGARSVTFVALRQALEMDDPQYPLSWLD